MPPIVHFQASQVDGDCAIVALANFLGVPYADVLARAVKITGDAKVHRGGMTAGRICKVAQAFDVTLRPRRRVTIEDDDDGIGWFSYDGGEHVALVSAGRVFEGFGGARLVWEPTAYMEHYGHRMTALLVKVQE